MTSGPVQYIWNIPSMENNKTEQAPAMEETNIVIHEESGKYSTHFENFIIIHEFKVLVSVAHKIQVL